MKTFLSGKLNKVIALFILFFLPRIICDALFKYDYELGSIIGVVFIAIFMIYLNKTSTEKHEDIYAQSEAIVFFEIIIMAITFQLFFFWFSYKSDTLTVNDQWLTYKNIVDLIIISPISEELLFRWSLTKICINDNSKIYSKVIFILFTTVTWNFLHGMEINVPVILIGLMLYLIFFKSNNILYCITMHIAINFVYFLLMSPMQNKLWYIFDNSFFVYIDISLFIFFFYVSTKRLCLKETYNENIKK